MQASFLQNQHLGLKMNPQVYQSIKLMELPLVDLKERINEELESNPALEALKEPAVVSLEESEKEAQSEFVEEYFETSSDSGFIHNSYRGNVASDEHNRFIEGVLARPETLQEHLLWQLQLEPVDEKIRDLAETLIQNLDDRGFHKEPPETLFKGRVPSLLPEAIRLVQSLEPAGCCTKDYREALKVQISLLRGTPSCMDCSLDHLELMEKGKYSAAAKKMNCKAEDVQACYKLIKKLSPFPGSSVTSAEVRYVIPDVQVVKIDGEFAIIINNEVIPTLGINPFFRKLVFKNKKKSSYAGPVRQFAQQNIREARFFISSIAMRNNTLKLVAGAILEFQWPFFEAGPKKLAPLTLGDIASALGIHETTVSRIANGKYMQTEWGIFELRYFFTNSISGTGSSGSNFSKGGVKAIILELVNSEKQNISDLDIVNILSRRGISIARRTVAKYRKELNLGSSYSRKRENP